MAAEVVSERSSSGALGRSVLIAAVVLGSALRLVHLGTTWFIWDETRDGDYARMSPAHLFAALREEVHPPLGYLLHSPVARLTSAEWPIRAESAMASIAAVVVMALWLGRRGRVGVIATTLFCLASFQLFYSWQARPYALMVLVGIGAAVFTTRWLERPTMSSALAVGLLALVGLLVSESTLLFIPGLAVVPGVRRDRSAWTWRGSIGAASLVWLVLWGLPFGYQLTHNQDEFAQVPLTTPRSLLITLNELVNAEPALVWLTVLAVLGGAILLVKHDRRLGRVWLCLFAVPFFIGAAAGLQSHVFWSKSLAFGSWAPMVAIAAGVDAAWRRWTVFAVPALAATALLILPSTAYMLRNPQAGHAPGWASGVSAIRRVIKPGDLVGAQPPYLLWPVRWYLGGPGREADLTLPGLDTPALLRGRGQWSGRLWILTDESALVAAPIGMVACPTPSPQVRCFQRHL